jgi:hypothetical protein
MVTFFWKSLKVDILDVKSRQPLPAKELAEAVKFVKKYHEGIVEKWTNFFVKNKKVRLSR